MMLAVTSLVYLLHRSCASTSRREDGLKKRSTLQPSSP
ncbi:hypothetical protein PC116_g10236 [Phytophthora cactorum]|uniref:Uncharacterized protein n=1 Tax=Phytophthora cactorum TaxID=29920 RepID=A0A8T1E0K1_9STRA|nr:hypothetical protein PC114_g7444 [Phytophthora cactorum]KAG2946814.1 hypothetical protein PC117_g7348 [Phytophthora cactorum]KAG3013565.1 hypothetical protein PC120_g13229 [Phytophthora cactorum]KAG3027885.1 hypothetical protein PC119_g7214 [Phytophthora cactorum]KAG3178497.1 hypothetical protein C6341_g7924 [Phytophthora cactorum]